MEVSFQRHHYQKAMQACDNFLFRGKIHATAEDMNRTITIYQSLAIKRTREVATKLVNVLDEMLEA